MGEQQKRWSRSTAASALLHGAALALLIVATRVGHFRAPQVIHPGDKSGTHITLNYSPHSAAGAYSVAHTLVASNARPSEASRPRPEPVLHSPLPSLAAPAAGEKGEDLPVAGQQGTGALAGSDSLGDGNMRIALASSFPKPEPDLHGLPHGFQGDVVVDVVIDETGKIADAKLVKGVSPDVDRTVIATVEQWVFTPATRDGNPVASQQELLFHYGPV